MRRVECGLWERAQRAEHSISATSTKLDICDWALQPSLTLRSRRRASSQTRSIPRQLAEPRCEVYFSSLNFWTQTATIGCLASASEQGCQAVAAVGGKAKAQSPLLRPPLQFAAFSPLSLQAVDYSTFVQRVISPLRLKPRQSYCPLMAAVRLKRRLGVSMRKRGESDCPNDPACLPSVSVPC